MKRHEVAVEFGPAGVGLGGSCFWNLMKTFTGCRQAQGKLIVRWIAHRRGSLGKMIYF